MEGWIKIHRKLEESIIFQNEKGLKIWIWCLLHVGHKDSSFLIGREKITLNRGQFVMGSKKASEFLGIAKSTLWFWLEFLEKEGQLVLKKTSKYTIVTIKNWDKYQDVELKSDANRPLGVPKIGTNKNVKNDKNVEEVPSDATASPNAEVAEIINLFKTVNPAYKKLFSQKPQRKAVESMIAAFGFDSLKKKVEFLEKSNAMPYAPRITTPYMLEVKMGDLVAFHAQEKNKKKTWTAI